ncbi:MAG: hypothetical protein F2927_01745 [Actinobacteria bacterium]|uniref:Unannotated protein n=1 Tax=freshwater metagenome TaxID=449393 RepID=A0A6J7T415_9ZZZZ|nr:hypothetical protein [Actinomycetota bacterium]MTB15475.1 hypothetical protein [Actinomycetota bacterium]
MNRSLHPLVWWIWAGAMATAVAMTSSISIAIAVVGVTAIVVRNKAEETPWAASFSWSLKMGLWVIAIRVLTGVLIGVPMPGRKILTLPVIPLPHWMAGIRIGGPVTLERLTSTAHDGIMIASIIALLGAAASLSSPHRLLRSMPVMVYEFGVSVVIATSILPQFVTSISRIKQAQRLRGHESTGLLSWRRIALPLFEETLSRSLDLAAAMDSRGYGFTRKRSKYRQDRWTSKDYLLCGIAMVSLVKPELLVLVAALSALVVAP